MSKIKLRTSLRILQWEMVISAMIISMPIMVPFYHSIGMNQGQIGLSQTMFTLSVLAINIPTGWIADRFSRKMSNAIGDFGCAVALVLYSMTTGFSQVVFCEILFGIALAFTNGADGALVKGHTDQLDTTGKLFHHVNSWNAIWRPAANAAGFIVGGIIGSANPRLCIMLSAIPFVIGSVLSLMVREEGVRLIQQHRNPLRDMWRVFRETVLLNPRLRWLIFAFGIGNGITHVMIWALTPLLTAAKVPLPVIGVGWVLNSVATTIGAFAAKRLAPRLKKWQRFAIPPILVVLALAIITLHLSLITVWLYAILGATYGWNSAVLLPMIQQETPSSNQASAISIAGTFSQIFYAPLVWLISYAGNVDIKMSMVATIAVFLPFVILTAAKLRKLER